MARSRYRSRYSRRSRKERSRRTRSRSSRRTRSRSYGRGRGSATRGWKRASVHTLGERRSLYKRCGSKCFLEPKDLKYPICSRSSKSCKPDCRGITSAYVRSRQYKNSRVSRSARKMQDKYCRRRSRSKSTRRSRTRNTRTRTTRRR